MIVGYSGGLRSGILLRSIDLLVIETMEVPGILVSLTNQRDSFYTLFEEIGERFQVELSLKIQKVN